MKLLTKLFIFTLFAPCIASAATGTKVDVTAAQYDAALKVAIRQAQLNQPEDAFPVLLQYARYGEKVAQNLVGTYLISGQGTPVDVAQGIVWMALSLEQQDKIWKKNYEKITAQLSKEQLAQLEVMIEQYRAKYGADAQYMSCRVEPRKTGSSLRIHLCLKIRDKDDDVQINVYAEDQPIPGAELVAFK